MPIWNSISLDALAESAERHIEKRSTWYLVILTVAYGVTVLSHASLKPFWYDELFTLYMSRLEGFTTLWSGLQNGVDLNPPFMYGAVKASHAVFGEGHVGTRVPMMIGFWVMSLSLYMFLRRYLTVVTALIGALFPAVTTAFAYSYEARAYGLVLGFAGLALVCWQHAVDSPRRPVWLAGFAVSLGLALLSHCYAVLLLFPFALAELVRNIDRTKIDWPVWICLGLSSTPVVIYPMLAAAAEPQIASLSTFKPHFTVVPYFYRSVFHPVLLLSLFAVLAAAFVVRSKNTPMVTRTETRCLMPFADRLLLTGLSLVPVLAFLLARFYTDIYLERYGLASVIGLAGLFALGIAWGMHLTPEAPRSVSGLWGPPWGSFKSVFRFQIQPLPSPRGAQ